LKTKNNSKHTSYISSVEKHPLRFAHKAMNTIYEIWIGHDNTTYAEQAAEAAFAEIDRLEIELSRFNSNSDISRINALKQYETITLGNDCYQCLKQCYSLYQQTKGIFDISAGFIIDLWKKLPHDQEYPPAEKIASALEFTGLPWLHLLDNFQVQLMSERISLDLGGYGKGYALKVAANLLDDWDISDGIISAGMSTIMPLSDSNWPIEISHPCREQDVLLQLDLSGKTISGSGIQKGQHIIDPRNGYPVQSLSAAWAIAADPGISDALSTAFMIMPVAEIKQYCSAFDVSAILVTSGDEIIKFGL